MLMKRSIMLKGPRACLPLLLFLIAFLACECWQAGGLAPEANVFLIFESAAEVRTVLLAQADRVKLAQNADHAPLRAGDAFHFCVPEAEEVHVTVRVFAEAGEALGEPLAQTAFMLDLSGGKTAVLKISDDAEDALQIEYAGGRNYALSQPA